MWIAIKHTINKTEAPSLTLTYKWNCTNEIVQIHTKYSQIVKKKVMFLNVKGILGLHNKLAGLAGSSLKCTLVN